MDKKLNRFYRIAIWIILILISTNILVKAIIWLPALKVEKDDYPYRIFILKDAYIERFTTEGKQKLFNKVDYLLTPAFTILFVVIAVKLIKTPGIFEEKD